MFTASDHFPVADLLQSAFLAEHDTFHEQSIFQSNLTHWAVYWNQVSLLKYHKRIDKEFIFLFFVEIVHTDLLYLALTQDSDGLGLVDNLHIRSF